MTVRSHIIENERSLVKWRFGVSWFYLAIYIDQFTCNCLFYPHLDAVHTADPFHLILGLELFRNTLAGGVLLYQQIEHLICCPVDLLQMGVQLAAEKQAGVNSIVVLL